MKKPWEHLKSFNDHAHEHISLEEEEARWKATTANEYYFAISSEPEENCGESGDVIVLITPIEYFQKTGDPSDSELNIKHLLPEELEMYEMMESTFESVKSIKRTRQLLLAAGFVENDSFTKSVNGIKF